MPGPGREILVPRGHEYRDIHVEGGKSHFGDTYYSGELKRVYNWDGTLTTIRDQTVHLIVCPTPQRHPSIRMPGNTNAFASLTPASTFLGRYTTGLMEKT